MEFSEALIIGMGAGGASLMIVMSPLFIYGLEGKLRTDLVEF